LGAGVVQGGVDEGEDPQGAAFRELREETGVVSAEVLGEVWSIFMLSAHHFCLIKITPLKGLFCS